MEKKENEQKEKSTALWKSHFSSNFNSLTYCGAWPIELNDKRKAIVYLIFQVIVFGTTMFLISSFFTDLFTVFGNIKKTSWNICVTSVFSGSVMKLITVYGKRNVINDLRKKLHNDMESRIEEKDINMQKLTVQQLRNTRRFMYICAFSFGCVWQVVRYKSKYTDDKQLPIPLYLPESVDLNEGSNFDMFFVLFSMLGISGLFFIIEQEMAMFSVLLQIKREYDILLTDIPKLDLVNDPEHKSKKPRERNPGLRIVFTRNMLKRLCIRQKTVMGYTDTFEYCYNHAMVVQVIVISILCVSIGLQCIMFSKEYMGELGFQVGYLFIVLTDMYVLCFMGSTLTAQCKEVGHALYNTYWYMMDLETQKDLSLMILTSQRPPRITCLKAVDINLSAFMGIMKNVYSWLALFRQVAYKSNT